MTTYQLTIGTGPQRFAAVINGKTFNFVLKWNFMLQVWVLDLYDVNLNSIVTGVPVQAGIDILEQFQYLGFGFSMFCATAGDTTTPPTFENLGGDGQLFVVVPPL